MGIGYVIGHGRGATDATLSKVANALIDLGHRPAGTVQSNTGATWDRSCDMDVRVLPSGPTIRISQKLGAGARGCRLNAGALETAVAFVDERLGDADCLIVNKFGKLEADGRGFRETIATAIHMDIPVLVGVNALNTDAFEQFNGGLAQCLEPDVGTILGWMVEQLGPSQSAKPVSGQAYASSA